MKHIFIFYIFLFFYTSQVFGQKLLSNTINKDEEQIIKKSFSFFYNSDVLPKFVQNHLDEVASIFLNNRNKNMVIYLKCDSNEPENLEGVSSLITRRERAVRQYLIEKGVEEGRVKLAKDSKFNSRAEIKKTGTCRCVTLLYDIL